MRIFLSFLLLLSAASLKATVENDSVAVTTLSSFLYDFAPGEFIEGYVLDRHVLVAGYPLKQRYWNHYPIVTQLIGTDINYSSQSITTVKPESRACLEGNLNDSICLDEYIFKGGHGDIWRAHKVPDSTHDNSQVPLILKRMKTKDNKKILLCALREIYFGKQLVKSQSFPKLITFFLHQGDYWLVFEDEGSSLQSYLYNSGLMDGRVLSPSRAWRKLRTSDMGAASMKSILFQLISNVAELHHMGIVHRDIKPSNILLQASRKPRLLVSDFSSAVDEFTLASTTSFSPLYENPGPSIAEETLDYAPPEVILSMTEDSLDNKDAIPYDYRRPSSFDIWSIGMVFLEMLLGTPDVFHVDQRAEALIIQLLQKRKLFNPVLKKKAILLAGLSDFGIFEGLKESTEPKESTQEPIRHSRRRKVSSFSQMIIGAATIPEFRPSIVVTSTSSTYMGKLDSASSGDVVVPEHANAAIVPLVEGTHQQRKFDTVKGLGPCSLSASKSNEYIAALSDAILHRDILGIGFHDKWGLDLLARLLCFDPMERISLMDALNHAYFHGPYMSAYDGKEFATLNEMIAHNQQFKEDRIFPDPLSSSSGNLGIFDDDHLTEILHIDLDTDLVDIDSTSSFVDSERELLLLPPFPISQDIDLHSFQRDDSIIYPENEEINSPNMLASAYSLQSRMELIRYKCPQCGRKFDDRLSCKQHMQSRRHGSYCHYMVSHNVGEELTEWINDSGHDILTHNEKLLSRILPQCLSDRSLGLRDEGSGWCDLHGRRRYMEDFHSIHHHYQSESTFNYSFFGVFDGHLGSFAARYSAHHVHVYFQEFLDDIIRYPEIRDEISGNFSHEALPKKESLALRYAFLSVDKDLSTAFALYRGDIPIGGSTATVLVFERAINPTFARTLLVGHVGDSRLVFCNFSLFHNLRIDNNFAVQVTSDHSTSSSEEVSAVLERGGKIITVDGVPRVQGELIVTRSLGDSLLGDVISSIPDIISIDIKPLNLILANSDNFESTTVSSCGKYYYFLIEQFQLCASNSANFAEQNPTICHWPNEISFAILASDGLWDVMGNEEAVTMVCDYFLENQYSLIQYLQFKQNISHFSLKNELDENDVDEDFLDLFQAVSRLLAYEALVRGSVDNIGVSVIDLSHD